MQRHFDRPAGDFADIAALVRRGHLHGISSLAHRRIGQRRYSLAGDKLQRLAPIDLIVIGDRILAANALNRPGDCFAGKHARQIRRDRVQRQRIINRHGSAVRLHHGHLRIAHICRHMIAAGGLRRIGIRRQQAVSAGGDHFAILIHVKRIAQRAHAADGFSRPGNRIALLEHIGIRRHGRDRERTQHNTEYIARHACSRARAVANQHLHAVFVRIFRRIGKRIFLRIGAEIHFLFACKDRESILIRLHAAFCLGSPCDRVARQRRGQIRRETEHIQRSQRNGITALGCHRIPLRVGHGGREDIAARLSKGIAEQAFRERIRTGHRFPAKRQREGIGIRGKATFGVHRPCYSIICHSLFHIGHRRGQRQLRHIGDHSAALKLGLIVVGVSHAHEQLVFTLRIQRIREGILFSVILRRNDFFAAQQRIRIAIRLHAALSRHGPGDRIAGCHLLLIRDDAGDLHKRAFSRYTQALALHLHDRIIRITHLRDHIIRARIRHLKRVRSIGGIRTRIDLHALVIELIVVAIRLCAACGFCRPRDDVANGGLRLVRQNRGNPEFAGFLSVKNKVNPLILRIGMRIATAFDCHRQRIATIERIIRNRRDGVWQIDRCQCAVRKRSGTNGLSAFRQHDLIDHLGAIERLILNHLHRRRQRQYVRRRTNDRVETEYG